MKPKAQSRESSKSRQFFIKISCSCKWRTATVQVHTYTVGDADSIKSQWRALGEQMEDEMIAESYKCDARRVVVRLEKG